MWASSRNPHEPQLNAGANSLLCLKLSPGGMLVWSCAGKGGGFLPLSLGCPRGGRALLSGRHLRHHDMLGADRQSGTFPRPFRRNRSLLSPLSARGSWVLLLPTAESGTGCPEPFVTSAWGIAGEGSAWHGATSPIPWKWGFGEGATAVPVAPSLPHAIQREGLRRAAVLP